MNYQDLPQRWKDQLTAYLQQPGIDNRPALAAGGFTGTVRVVFEEDSEATFQDAFVLDAPVPGAIGFLRYILVVNYLAGLYGMDSCIKSTKSRSPFSKEWEC